MTQFPPGFKNTNDNFALVMLPALAQDIPLGAKVIALG